MECIFCCEENVSIVRSGDLFWIFCQYCGSKGPERHSNAAASASWEIILAAIDEATRDD